MINSYEKAMISDFLEIAKLDRTAWEKNDNSKFIPDGEHAWRIWVENSLVFIAKNENDICGAILAFPCISGKWCIHKVFVKRKLQGKGIGTKLFETLLKEVDEINVSCFLTVDPNNKRAIKLYNKWGFSRKKFIKSYYRESEDRFVLSRDKI